MNLEFRVPLVPPSINKLWRSKGNGKGNYKIAAAKSYAEAVGALVPRPWGDSEFYHVELIFGLEPRRFMVTDCDNLVKVCMDALQEVGIITDDKKVLWFSAGKIRVSTIRDEFTKYVLRGAVL